MRAVFGTIAAAVGAAALAACNPVANLDAATTEIEQFHANFNAGNLDKIWSEAAPAMREASPRAEFDRFLGVTRDRLGQVESSERTGFKVESNTGGTFTVVTMQTTYERGTGTEVFTLSGNDEDMKLAGWNIDSTDLIFNTSQNDPPPEAAPGPES